MKVTIWGSRGSLANAGPDTIRYGGNTACVEIAGDDGTTLVLDAGTGLRALGRQLVDRPGVIHVLLTHLHMDHIQGLGFFKPFFQPGREIHVWGPPSTTLDLRSRLTRYLSPPLFPVRIGDIESELVLHDVGPAPWRAGPFQLTAASVIHPGPTVGYRVALDSTAMAYLPDHEPALGGARWTPAWTSGYGLAADVDLLVHDGQYTPGEYAERVGWGHSSVEHVVAFAELASVKRVALFHHDPDHDDAEVDEMLDAARRLSRTVDVVAASEGSTFQLGGTVAGG
jgi:phosphoribosyl 1,2-cyclic phosphodiesterase